ncbi:MAG: hypothetical protein IT207_00750 [Fimbriimonadaceae bacterium]|nr:hypothetical protein [Fimbriimonadaceae bacterium]
MQFLADRDFVQWAGLGLALTTLLLTTTGARSPQNSDLRALDGEWIFVEDRTEGRTLEQLNPPMSSKFVLRTEERAVVLVSGHGSGHREVRIALNGTPTEVENAEGTFSRYIGSWKEGVLTYEVVFFRGAGKAPEGLIQREFRMTEDGLVVRSNLELTPGVWSVGLYRHAEDIPMPAPTRAVIGDLAWLVGPWVGTRGTGGTTTIEERWSPAKGGSMLAVARTVSREKMSAFEFLRIVERDGGLVYIAQPNGGAPTEFVMTELGDKRAVFENPRHDYPKRIVYEVSSDGALTATIGQSKGGTPRKFEFTREGG